MIGVGSRSSFLLVFLMVLSLVSDSVKILLPAFDPSSPSSTTAEEARHRLSSYSRPNNVLHHRPSSQFNHRPAETGNYYDNRRVPGGAVPTTIQNILTANDIGSFKYEMIELLLQNPNVYLQLREIVDRIMTTKSPYFATQQQSDPNNEQWSDNY